MINSSSHEKKIKKRIGPKDRFPITRLASKKAKVWHKQQAIHGSSAAAAKERIFEKGIGPKGRFPITRCVKILCFDLKKQQPSDQQQLLEKRIKKRNRPEGPMPNYHIWRKIMFWFKQKAIEGSQAAAKRRLKKESGRFATTNHCAILLPTNSADTLRAAECCPPGLADTAQAAWACPGVIWQLFHELDASSSLRVI